MMVRRGRRDLISDFIPCLVCSDSIKVARLNEAELYVSWAMLQERFFIPSLNFSTVDFLSSILPYNI